MGLKLFPRGVCDPPFLTALRNTLTISLLNLGAVNLLPGYRARTRLRARDDRKRSRAVPLTYVYFDAVRNLLVPSWYCSAQYRA